MQAALAHGIEIPYFCWHPELSVAGNCRICVVQVEGRSWVEIACNMPVARRPAGAHRLRAGARRTASRCMQLITLNHPVDCGICDKAGECTLQDYHYEYNGAPSVSRDAKVRATKFHALSERIVLDNERCILCSRCVRFTREISKSNALGIVQRGDTSLVRAAEDRRASTTTRTPTTSSTSARWARCCRGRSSTRRASGISSRHPRSARAARAAAPSQIWHRKQEWKLNALDPRQNVSDRARDAAREPGGQRALDLQQGTRPRADLRAPARDAGDAEGQARRSAAPRSRPRGA